MTAEEQFYQPRPGYWQQVTDNAAGWLGVQHLNALDIVILLSLFPFAVLCVFWMLPLDEWVPKKILGPYLLYCAFALWHFHARPWMVLGIAIVGVIGCATALKDIRRLGKPWRRPET